MPKMHHYLLDFIKSQGGQTREYDLLKYIDAHHAKFFESLGRSPTLFQKHFFLFHHLYLLNEQLRQENSILSISALEIQLCSVAEHASQLGFSDPLKSFYLNFNNLYLPEQEVAQMMRGFWQKYLALDQKSDAIKILGLCETKVLNQQVLKKRYALLAKQHHPDKGGDKNQFILIEQAYQTLKALLKN